MMNTGQTESKKTLAVIALLTVQILFGINYITSKVVMHSIPPVMWGAVRIIFSALGLVVMARVMKRPAFPLTRTNFPSLFMFSFLGITLSQTAFLTGLSLTTATNSSILNTLGPVFTLIAVTLMGKERLTVKRLLGFAFALSGVLVLRQVENFSLSDQTVVGDLLIMLNALGFGLYLAVSKDFLKTHDPLWTTAWTFIIGGVTLFFISIPTWFGFHVPELTLEFIVCVVFSIFGATLMTYFLSMWALAHLKSSSVALFVYLQPLVAFILAWAFFSEEITLRAMGSGLLIFIGMILGMG